MNKFIALGLVAMLIGIPASVISQTPAKEWPKPTPPVQKMLDDALKIADVAHQIEALKKVLEAAKAANDVDGQAACEYSVGKVSNGTAAIPWFEAAIRDYDAAGNTKVCGHVLNSLGDLYCFTLGRQAKARDAYNKALVAARAINYQALECRVLTNLGAVCYFLRDYEKEIEYCQQSLTICRATRERAEEAKNLSYIGDAYQDLNQNQKAIDFFNQAIPIYEEIGDKVDVERRINIVGNCYLNLGQNLKALEYYNRAVPLQRAAKDFGSLAVTLTNIGIADHNLGRLIDDLDIQEQALKVEQENGLLPMEARTMNAIGSLHQDLEGQDSALRDFTKALDLARKVGDQGYEALILGNMALSYQIKGDHSKALDFYQQALSLFKRFGDIRWTGVVLGNIGGIQRSMGQYEKAIESDNEALRLNREAGDEAAEAGNLNGIGDIYTDLGQYGKALEVKRQALAIQMKEKNKIGAAETLSQIAGTYNALGQNESALDYFEIVLRLAKEMRAPRLEAAAEMNVGFGYSHLGQGRTALDHYLKALTALREAGDRSSEELLLTDMGSAYRLLGQNWKALSMYNQALAMNGQSGHRKNKADTLDDMSHSLASLKLRGLAILFAKQSVNVFQTMRKDMQNLPKQDQDGYAKVVEPTYRHLADLLIQQGRLREAEQVMNLLKQEENFEFVARDAAVAGGVEGRIEAIGAEAGWWSKYQLLQDKALKIDSDEFDLTQKASKLNAATSLTTAEKLELSKMKDKLKELDRQKEVLDKAADAYFEDVGKQASALGDSIRKEAEARVRQTGDELPTLLRRLHRDSGESIGAVYALASSEELDFLLVTFAGRAHVSVPVTSDELNQMISAFRKELTSPDSDPRPMGEKLYHLVFEKVIRQLHAAGCSRVVWCLDGTLRYVPIGALWDGKQYLIERDDFTMFDPLNLDRVSADSAKTPLAAGFAATEGKGTTFAPLPGADNELRGVVKDDSKAGFAGAVPGRAYENKEFDQANLVSAMKGDQFSLLHIATHFNVGKDFNSSNLLLGDGNLLSLKQFTDTGAHGQLGHFDLVCLSACDTAESFGDAVSAGSQFSSFVSLTLNDGASSVVASLWPVSDASTPVLMKRFYESWVAHKDKGKAEALRSAQLSLLYGESRGAGVATRSVAANSSQSSSDKTFVKDPKRPFAHPYYWAPFILFGNWK